MNAALIPTGKVVADIGCDHAKLPIYLIENKMATKVIAMDIGEGPLARAKDNINGFGMEESIECRLSDGAQKLGRREDNSPEADVIVMAGIGGRLALKIVDESIDIFRDLDCFIIQAQSELDVLRKDLYGKGFFIEEEDMVYEEGKYYTADRWKYMTEMSFHTQLSDAELLYGPRLIEKRHPVLFEYLQKENEKYKRLMQDIPEDKNTIIKDRYRLTEELLDWR